MVKLLGLTLLVTLNLVLTSCSSIQSGHYVLLEKNIGPEQLAKKYNISVDKIMGANQDRPFVKGQWVFIPQERGVMRAFKQSVPASSGQESVTAPDNGDVDISSFDRRFSWPVPTVQKVSSHYGGRWGRKHEGIDIPAHQGTPFVSVDDGVVIYSGKGIRAYGNLTVVAHTDGFFSVYAHAKKNYTKKGQKVFRGQVIGQVGRTGRATGPHLHFELRKESRALDPLAMLHRQ